MTNSLKNYVDYVKPVVRAIRENHNQFYDLTYYEISPEDLFGQDEKDLVDFMDPFGGKFTPKDFTGDIPLAYASFGEETGARIVLELSPENRKKLSEEVVDVFSGMYHREASDVYMSGRLLVMIRSMSCWSISIIRQAQVLYLLTAGE